MYKPLALIAVAAVAMSAFAFKTASSGLATGERVTPFHPTHIVGPLKDTTNCFPCTFQNRPQVQVWINGSGHSEDVKEIAKTLSKAMKEHKDKEFKALMVLVAPEAKHKELAKMVKAEAEKMGTTNIGIALIDPKNEALENYKINLAPEVKNTVFAYKNWKVEQKFVNLNGDKAGIQQLNEAISTITN